MVECAGEVAGDDVLLMAYQPSTSPKAVTRREPPSAFFTKKEGFRYSIKIPTSSGRLKTPQLFELVEFLLQFYESVSRVLG